MATFLDLPDEIFEEILLDPSLTAQDISRFSSSFKRGRDIVFNSGQLWKRLMTAHYPNITCQIKENPNIEPHTFWYQTFTARYALTSRVRQLMTNLSNRYFDKNALSNTHLEHFLQQNQDFEGLLIIDALRELTCKGDPDTDLTLRYYGEQVIQFVCQHFLGEKWNEFKLKEPENQDYYQGLVMISQWFQPLEDVNIFDIRGKVREIALAVLDKLKETYPNHPIFQLDKTEQILSDTNATLDEDRFGGGQRSLEILNCLNAVFFEDFRFHGNTDQYYSPVNSYIDKVLENRQGIPITLCILYSLIAKLLGVVILPINFPRHFLLRWKDQQTGEEFYIDAFQKGQRNTSEQIRVTRNHNPQGCASASPMEVFQRMVRNLMTCAQILEHESMNPQLSPNSLIRKALELTKLIGGQFEYPGFLLCQIYLQLSINSREVMQELDNYENWPQMPQMLAGPPNSEHFRHQIRGLKRLCASQMEEETAEEEHKEVKYRSSFSDAYDSEDETEGLSLYAIGMVMKHRRYDYHCVIFGWDPKCTASRPWIQQMGVHKLPRKDNQPFYNVLVEDGSVRYAADESLTVAKPQRITHSAVGRYFKEFKSDVGYIANDTLLRQYPEDQTRAAQLHLQYAAASQSTE